MAESTEDRVEWARSPPRSKIIYATADFLEKAENLTIVKFAQGVELRRNHPGNCIFWRVSPRGFITKELSRRVTEMIRIFIRKAKEKLEK